MIRIYQLNLSPFKIFNNIKLDKNRCECFNSHERPRAYTLTIKSILPRDTTGQINHVVMQFYYKWLCFISFYFFNDNFDVY